MTEKSEKPEKSLFSLIDAASAMIDGLGSKEPEAPKAEAPKRPSPRMAQKIERTQQAKEDWDTRHSLLEDTVLDLLFDLKARGLVQSDDKINVSIDFADGQQSQYVSVKLSVEK